MNKKLIINEFIKIFKNEVQQAELAATQAHLAATDDQSIAETQYDTLAIESAYLAEGQSRRVEELKRIIELILAIPVIPFSTEDKIALGALIQTNDMKKNEWLLLSSCGGGYKVVFDKANISLVTAGSPLGKALISSYVDDEITFNVARKTITKVITAIK